MNLPSERYRYIDQHHRQLAKIARMGHQNVGRGAVVVFSDTSRTGPHHWSGTAYPYFMEDCLTRRLIHDVWLRNDPSQRAEVLAGFIREVSRYNPLRGMVVVFLSVTGAVRSCHVPLNGPREHTSTAAV